MKEYFACIGDAVECKCKQPNNTLTPGIATIVRKVEVERPRINGREIALVGDLLKFDKNNFWPLTDKEGVPNIKVHGCSVAKAEKVPESAKAYLVLNEQSRWSCFGNFVVVD